MRTPDENARAQVAHDMAFNELPPRAHSDMGQLRSEFEESPDMAVARYFLQAAKHRGVKANATTFGGFAFIPANSMTGEISSPSNTHGSL